jgi:hypothetical protein
MTATATAAKKQDSSSVSRKVRGTVKMTEAKRLEDLISFIRLCFLELEAGGITSTKEIADLTKLSTTTILRLWAEDVTLRIQFRTLQNLGFAAGMKIELRKTGMEIQVVEGKERT